MDTYLMIALVQNNIPVFSPALTDGSIGDMMYFHSYRKEGLILDIASDIRRVNDLAIRAPKTGVLILGGGVVKHHILNANLMRNGADFSVFVNTGQVQRITTERDCNNPVGTDSMCGSGCLLLQEFDGSDAGARPDEAISWGKIRLGAKPVKVCGPNLFCFVIAVVRADSWVYLGVVVRGRHARFPVDRRRNLCQRLPTGDGIDRWMCCTFLLNCVYIDTEGDM